jgi:hypothetical protein
MAATLYDVVDVGTKVVVTHDAPASNPMLTAGTE